MKWALCVGFLSLMACGPTVPTRPDGSAPWPSNHPMWIQGDGGVGLVSNSLSDDLSVLDRDPMREQLRVPVGIDPLAIDGPHHLAVDPVGRRVFVALSYPPPRIPSGPHGAHGASTVSGVVQALSLDDFHEVQRQPIDANPGEIVLTPDRSRVVVTHFDLQRVLTAIANGQGRDAMLSRLYLFRSDSLVREAAIPLCIAAHGVAVTPDSRLLVAACYGEDSVAVVHLDDLNAPVEVIPVGPGPGTAPTVRYGPYSVLMTRDGSRAFVADLEGKDIRVFDVGQRRFTGESIPLNAAVMFGSESLDGTHLYFPTQSPDGLVKIRRSDLSVVRSTNFNVATCQLPHEVAVSSDGGHWLVCEGNHRTSGAVMRFDPDSLLSQERVEVGIYPDRVVFVGGGSR